MAKHAKRKAGASKSGPAASSRSVGTPRTGTESTHWKLVLLQLALIAAAGAWIFSPVLQGGWLWDDDLYITNNPLLRNPAGLWKIWFEGGSFVEYYPIGQTVQWIQWQLWGNDPLGYHLTNVFLHFVGACLVWRLLAKLGLRLAWLGGLLFVIHPVQVESVAWMAELKNTLSLPPFLIAMCAWIDYEEHHRRRDYLLALGFFLIAMLCKITMAPFPAVILLYAWWKRGRIGWSDLKTSLPFLAISVELGINLIMVANMYHKHVHALPEAVPLGGIFSRLACAGAALSFYFSKCFWPVGLLPIYPQWSVDPPSLAQFLPWPVFGGIICWFWSKRKGWGADALLGFGFFLLMLSPFLGFVAVSYMSFTWVMDHFLYIPIIGLIGLAVAALGQMDGRLPAFFRLYGRGIAAVVLSLLAWESHAYAGKFINQETLWTYTLQYNPTAPLAHNDLGVALMGSGRIAMALEEFGKALQLYPDYAEAHNNRGIALIQTGRAPEAMDEFKETLRLNPYAVEAHNNLGKAFMRTNRQAEARDQFEAAIKIQPENVSAYVNLGTLLLQSGHAQEAVECFQRAVQLAPDLLQAHLNLANALLQAGRNPEAIEQYEQVLAIDPGLAAAHENLGIALGGVGRVPEAIEQFEAASQLNPNDADARDNLGIALEQMNRVPEAIGQFKAALRINPHDATAQKKLTRLQGLPQTAPTPP